MKLHTHSMRARAIAVAAVSVMSASCTLTPQPRTPEVVERISTLDTFENAPRATAAAANSTPWWQRLGGAELSTLVTDLRTDSLLLAESRLQAEQARERLWQARASRLPAATASIDAANTQRPAAGGGFSWNDDYAGSLAASLDTDVFGKLRATERAATLNALAADLTYRATEQREIAILARNWVSAATLQRRLDLARTTAASFGETYALTDQRYRAGSPSSTASDVLIAKQNLEFARADIPELATQLQTQLLVIDEQLARLPGESASAFVGELALEVSPDVPLGRPASLLAKRPDVAAAELRYRAALEDVGAARANLYPALTLTAALTFQSDTPEDVFDWDRHITNLAAALTQPVFQGGRLRSQVRLEQARALEFATAFGRTTLAAVIDVESSLAALAGLTEQRRQLEEAVDSANKSNDIAQTRYRQGLASILAVLETQRSLNSAQLNLILTEQALLNAQIDLYLGLGGDWSE